MSIAVLTQVYDEVRRLAIAGSNLASGDFRLKKLVAPLEASAAKAPVFGKVAQAISAVVDAQPKDSAAALLELSTLVSAILYTQGETGIEGSLDPIETTDIGLPTANTSARVLKPLIESLTTTGSGREEIIKDAQQRGAFKDLRLVRVAVAAIDDPYGPIADFVAENVLPLYGKAVYDDLRANFNPKAKGGHVRRLKLMHRLDPTKTHELVEQSLESGSPDMKVAAIGCLEGNKDSLSYLLEQSRAKSGEVRRAALRAMSGFGDDVVVEALIKSLSGNDLDLAAESASRNRSPKLLAFLLEEAEKQLAELPAVKDKEKLNKALTRFQQFLACFASRDDKQSIAFLTKCFEQRDKIGPLKGDVDGQQVNHYVASLLVESKVLPVMNRLIEAHASLAPEVLDQAILAAVRTRKPKEVYDLFAPYYRIKVDAKKRKTTDAAGQKREAVRELLSAVSGRYYRYRPGLRAYFDEADQAGEPIELDPRWLDAAIETGDVDIVLFLARPKHKPSAEYLSAAVTEMLAKKGDLDYDVARVLETMLRIEHPDATRIYLEALKKIASVKSKYYYAYWIARLIPSLPAAAAPQIETLLPDLPEKVVDQITPYLAELQAKGNPNG